VRPNALRQLFADKRCALGGWTAFSSPYAAEVMGHSGLDAVVVDLQHGTMHLDGAVPMLQALSSTPAMPMARCSGNDFAEINKLLDAGAYGIICPMIDTADDARRLVDACRYPPAGRRSFGPTRGMLYGGPDYYEHANSTVLAYAMIETPLGMKNLDAICAVDGLDGVFVGPSDLSLALGVHPTPRWKDEPLAGALKQILAAARRAGKMAACFCAGSEAMSIDMKKLGFDFVIVAIDSALVSVGARKRVDGVRQA
jgi:4-hydroxy-2-oxoheptanedioate aldolase